MAKGPWLDAIVEGLGRTTEGFTISSGPKRGPNGERMISLEFVDPIRGGRFSMDLPDDSTNQQVKTEVRKAWRRFVRSHPIARRP